MVIEKQIHTQIGCADARDLSQIQIDSLHVVLEDFKKKGIEINFHVIRAACTFITPDVVMGIE